MDLEIERIQIPRFAGKILHMRSCWYQALLPQERLGTRLGCNLVPRPSKLLILLKKGGPGVEAN